MRVHPAPEVKDYRGFLFKTFEDGAHRDPGDARARFHAEHDPPAGRRRDRARVQHEGAEDGLRSLLPQGHQVLPQEQGLRPSVLDGDRLRGLRQVDRPHARERARDHEEVRRLPARHERRRHVAEVEVRHALPARLRHGSRGDVRRVGDVGDLGATCCRSTGTPSRPIKGLFAAEQGGNGYVGCHVSHTYKTGACLYFTYAAKQLPGKELEQYYKYKAS